MYIVQYIMYIVQYNKRRKGEKSQDRGARVRTP